MWNKLQAAVGDCSDPAKVLAASDETLRGAGLSRQKMSYARSLAAEVICGRLDLHNLAESDEAAIAELARVKGIDRSSAPVYLLFPYGYTDVWTTGDLLVQLQAGTSVQDPATTAQ